MLQKNLFEKTKAASETRLALAEVLWDAALTEAAVHRDCLRDKVAHLSSDRSVRGVELKTTRRQLSATRIEVGSVSGQLTEKKGLKEEAELIVTDVHYELYGGKAKSRRLRIV